MQRDRAECPPYGGLCITEVQFTWIFGLSLGKRKLSTKLLETSKAPSTLIRIDLKTHKMQLVQVTNPVAKTDKMFSVHTETLPLTQEHLNAW